MKKVFALLALFAILLGLAACGGAPAETPTTEATTEATEAPEVPATIELVKGGVSDFVIVHEATTEASNFAAEVRMMLSAAYGVTLDIVGASQVQESTPQIVIGKVGAAGESAAKKLTGEFDFTVRIWENKLLLCAKDQLSYSYLGQYLKREVFVKGESNDRTMTSEADTFLYSQSDLMEINYVDYWMAENAYFPFEEIFAYETFQGTDATLPYRIYVPFNYTPEKEYPLLLNLHGAGLRGSDNQRHLKFIDTAMKNPELEVDDAIILFPQCPDNEKWVDTGWGLGSYNLDNVPESNEMKAVMELIGQLQQDYSIDEKRIYSMGFSMGGYGTWNLLMNHPDVFAAGIPMCGAGDPNQAGILKDIPIWAVHGALDPTVPVSGSRDMAKALEAAGAADFHYTEIADAEHDVWNYTYNNVEMFQWLFSQKKA